MTTSNYRETLHLLDSALALVSRERQPPAPRLRREFRCLAREFVLLRARLGQPPARLQRN